MEKYYCNNCKVSVAGQNTCPLCGAYVGDNCVESNDRVDLAFPSINKEVFVKMFIMRVLIFVTVLSLGVVLLVDWIATGAIDWSLNVAVGWLIFWLTIGRTVFFHLQLRRQIVWDCLFACALVLYIQYLVNVPINSIGFTIIIPCVIMSCIAGMQIIMLMKFKSWNRFALPTTVLCLISLIPLIVSLCVYHEAYFPLYMAAIYGVLTQLAMMLFGHKKYFIELKKKFHI